MNILTHLFFGLTLFSIFDLNIYGVIIGSVLPDFDMFFTIPHRTLTHSFIFLIIVSFLFYSKNKKIGISLFIGILSHLILDVITSQGIQLLYPYNKYFTFNLFNSSNKNINFLFISIFGIIMLNSKLLKEKLMDFKAKNIRLFTYSLFLLPLLFSIYLGFTEKYQLTTITELLNNKKNFENQNIQINGFICSEIEFKEYSSYSNYLIFNLCEKNDTILVWVIEGINDNLNINDNITVFGKFTDKYDEPEIYYIDKIKKNILN